MTDSLWRKRQEPEQEPVAWNAGVAPMWPQQKEGETFSVSYTTTPQRTWVGLSDEECRLIYTSAMEAPVRDQVTVCKAIEAKLKQKNGYTEE